jgi:outer membrane protein assembly factor BamE (lipoprotein component of BamABCDE complex)
VAGCTTTSRYTSGVDFDAEKRYQIVKKVSTKEDVKKLYGEPLDKGIDENYHEQWIYVYSVGESEFNIWTSDSRGENRVKKLIVIFDENDVVMNHVYSDSTVPSEASF